MFVRTLDYLSPSVTFYHKGYLSHNSIPSGILSIIAIICLIILAVYYALDIIERSDPNTTYFNRFVEDAGTIQINSTSLFHFVTPSKNIRGHYILEDFDFTLFNIIGTNIYYTNFISMLSNGGPLQSLEFWIYGPCNKDEDGIGLEHLINYELFEKSACIKQFYANGQYYKVGDPEFKWPEISHGTFTKNNILYNLIVKKCDNSLIGKILGDGYHCKGEDEMVNYFKSANQRTLNFYFLNNYINVLNYEKPIYQFFYRLENPFEITHYTANNLNIKPSLLATHDGLVFDNIKKQESYVFDRNDVYIEEDNADVYMVYVFFLKNIMEYYERIYKRIQDVISSIGGINQAITIVAMSLNKLYNNYIVLSDTEVLLHSSIDYEKKNHKEKSNLQNLNNKLKGIEKDKKNKQNEISGNFQAKFNSEKKVERKKRNKTTNEISINNSKSNSNIFTTKDPEGINKIKEDINISEKRKNDEKTKENTDISFWNYILFKISCEKRKSVFYVYQKFRTKIISEEHLIRNHLNIYNLMRFTERKRNSTSVDQKINYTVPCLKSSIFAEVEEKLYQEYPEYREANNSFLANGMQILHFKTIEENNIRKGRPLMLLNPNSEDE